MDLPIFYAPPENIIEDTITLPAVEGRHAIKVMRLAKGDLVMVVDGLGIALWGFVYLLQRMRIRKDPTLTLPKHERQKLAQA